ncbi:hypothetical protein [Alkalimonas mucilaginosa]|uniref:Type I restriction enzyme R protein N-terminal domain-containing protein n=1 Tax=Alkalimonas mucilaginosa TaxID=3057676 RepID=A0ABU7JBJ6_9GAMM|nr:hypothetical protein [Alkalimonas sp. MEB004]MEE2023067.1 hypothetical protein [Alkalimonas sp. MEB004]
MAGGVCGRRCFVDYLLHKDNRYLAVVEAKKESEHLAASDILKHICTKEKLESGLLDKIEDLLVEK